MKLEASLGARLSGRQKLGILNFVALAWVQAPPPSHQHNLQHNITHMLKQPQKRAQSNKQTIHGMTYPLTHPLTHTTYICS